MNSTQRDELLIRLDERTARADKALFGNGQPGLQTNVVKLQEEMLDVQRRAPSKKEKSAGWSAIVLAVIAAGSAIGVALAERGG